jgi:hypothetical protein
MRLPVRVFFRCLSFLLIFFLLLPIFTSLTHAQTPPPASNQYITPNLEPNVPRNQHTMIQSLFLEILLAFQCQLTGIDLVDPTKSCLGVNLKTGQLGYAPPSTNNGGGMQIGGLLGMINQGVGTMYTPTFGSQDYFRYVASDFGIVKSTYAAAYTGFDGLSPILGLWKTTRDIAYYLLIIAFIFIGIGVMLRLKIDPRTVMTVQNQIPRVIICIILITFSYAFAGLMIDTMWAVTYMGVNKITEAANPRTDCSNPNAHLNDTATRHILGNPFAFVNQTFGGSGGTMGCVDVWGVFDLAKTVSNQIARIEADIVWSFLFGADDRPGQDCDLNPWGGMSLDGCWELGLLVIIEWVASIIWFIIVLIALIIALFRIWFELLKAYVMVLLYVILAPIWIVFGLLPKRPLGFEKWLRVYFANLAVFPAVVFILVGARALGVLFDASTTRFVPPLIGEPDTGAFGAILEFGMVLMAPQLLSLIREKLSVQPNKQTAAAMQTFNAGRTAAGTPAKQAIKHMNKRDQYGNAVGPLASMTDRFTNWGATKAQKMKLPTFGMGGAHDKQEYMRQNYGSLQGYGKGWQGNKDDFDHARREAKASNQGKAFDDKFMKGGNPDYEGWRKENPVASEGVPVARTPQGVPIEGTVTPTTGAEHAAQPVGVGVGEGIPTGEGAPAAGRQEIVVRIVGPNGQETPVNLGAAGEAPTHEVVLNSIQDPSSRAGFQAYINTERARSQAAGQTSMWDKSANQILPSESEAIQSVLNTHVNPPTGRRTA